MIKLVPILVCLCFVACGPSAEINIPAADLPTIAGVMYPDQYRAAVVYARSHGEAEIQVNVQNESGGAVVLKKFYIPTSFDLSWETTELLTNMPYDPTYPNDQP
jgi:hypothetical protein